MVRAYAITRPNAPSSLGVCVRAIAVTRRGAFRTAARYSSRNLTPRRLRSSHQSSVTRWQRRNQRNQAILGLDPLFSAFQQRKHPVEVFHGWSPTIENSYAAGPLRLGALVACIQRRTFPYDPRGFAPAPSSTVTTRQLPAQAAYQSAVRPCVHVLEVRSGLQQRLGHSMRPCTTWPSTVFWAATLPIGRSFGLAPAFTSRSTIELERAEPRGGNRFFGGPSRSPPSSINLRAIGTSSRSIASCKRVAPSSPDAIQPERVSSSSASSSRNTQRFVPAAASISRSNSSSESGAASVVFDAFRATVDRDRDNLRSPCP